MKPCRVLAALSLTLVLAAQIFADSDAYYCAAPGYLAFEMVDPDGAHHLHLVYFSSGTGIAEPLRVGLERFQTHGMRCSETEVELASWDAVYVVNLTVQGPPRVERKIVLPQPGTVPPGFVSSNLGHWSQEGVVTLPAPSSSPFTFELVVAKVGKPLNGGSEVYTVTDLIQRGERREITSRLRLFTGIFFEPIH